MRTAVLLQLRHLVRHSSAYTRSLKCCRPSSVAGLTVPRSLQQQAPCSHLRPCGPAWVCSASKSQTPGDSELDAAERSEYASDDLFEEGEDDEDAEPEPEDWDTAVGGLDTAGTPWGQSGLEAAQQVLEHPTMQGLTLHLFKALPAQQKLVIALDRLDSPVGSPTFEDLQAFQEAFTPKLAAAVGQQLADQLDVEVSTPGAERAVSVPGQLERFRDLPMLVSWGGQQKVLSFDSLSADGSTTVWRLANVGANRKVKGRLTLSNKQRQERYELPCTQLDSVRLHLDI